MPQCQPDKTFTVLENEAVLPWDGMQGLMGSPDHDDHSLAELGLGQNKIQALMGHGTCSIGHNIVSVDWEAEEPVQYHHRELKPWELLGGASALRAEVTEASDGQDPMWVGDKYVVPI